MTVYCWHGTDGRTGGHEHSPGIHCPAVPVSRPEPPFVWVYTEFDGRKGEPGTGPIQRGIFTVLDKAQAYASGTALRRNYLVAQTIDPDDAWELGGLGLWGPSGWRRGKVDGSGPWQSIDKNYLDPDA